MLTSISFSSPMFSLNIHEYLHNLIRFHEKRDEMLILLGEFQSVFESNFPPSSFPQLKFMFSNKATKIDEIFTFNLTLCSKCQIDGEIFFNFCGLLRKHEL